jgi:hypothetical protein
MMKSLRRACGKLRAAVLILSGLTVSAASAADAKRPVFMAHFMPWHQTPEVSGYWGYHWTMNHFNPEKTDSTGRREIASHYYPLTGPYDSQDQDILEYQILLMKLSGIDGVMVDWYGMEDFADYAKLNEATQATFEMIRKAGLKFSIVYEDQTVKHMVESGHLSAAGALDHGKAVMRYLQDNWFAEAAYLKLEGRPVLLTFGPQYFMNSPDWTAMFSGLPAAPLFFTLDNRLSPAAAGAFPWPPMWKTTPGGRLTQASLNDYLNPFYRKAAAWDYRVASAFPGFDDIYREAGVSQGYGILDSGNGATFTSTLRQAMDSDPDVVQLVTWNDYGEGTIIEPTREFGYQYLEIVQNLRRSSVDSLFPFRPEDLTVPARILDFRRTRADDATFQSKLNRVFGRIVSGDRSGMNAVMDSLSASGCGDGSASGEFDLGQNFPNPFNQSTRFRYRTAATSRVTVSVHDASGRRVQVLLDGPAAAGCGSIEWNAGGLDSGVYLVRMNAGNRTVTRKCVKVK